MSAADVVDIDAVGAWDPYLVLPRRTIPLDVRMALTLVFGWMAGRPLRPKLRFDGCGFPSCACVGRCEVAK